MIKGAIFVQQVRTESATINATNVILLCAVSTVNLFVTDAYKSLSFSSLFCSYIYFVITFPPSRELSWIHQILEIIPLQLILKTCVGTGIPFFLLDLDLVLYFSLFILLPRSSKESSILNFTKFRGNFQLYLKIFELL